MVVIVAMVLIGVALLGFVIHTIRCYLNKPSVDEDEENEYRVQYNKNENIKPI